MAQKVLVELIDDLKGGPAEETVRFGLDGREYEIDLNGKHAKDLRKTVEGYARCGRKVRAAGELPLRSAARRRYTLVIRAWAKEQGHTFSDRGRIPVWIVDEYERVHGT